MNKQELLKFCEDLTKEMIETMKKKNADYTGTTDDPFANFTRVESLGICKTEVGFMTRMTDKLCRINSFVQKSNLEVNDESVKDTLSDLANYCLLFMAYLESKKTPTQFCRDCASWSKTEYPIGQCIAFEGIPLPKHSHDSCKANFIRRAEP